MKMRAKRMRGNSGAIAKKGETYRKRKSAVNAKKTSAHSQNASLCLCVEEGRMATIPK